MDTIARLRANVDTTTRAQRKRFLNVDTAAALLAHCPMEGTIAIIVLFACIRVMSINELEIA